MSKNTRYVGLDVHKETISVAVAEPGRAGEVRYLGRIANSEPAIRKLVKKLGPAEELCCCYEAGPCGYVLYWQLTRLGVDCTVVAPSLIPKAAIAVARASGLHLGHRRPGGAAATRATATRATAGAPGRMSSKGI